jgi:hypothetical protein
METLKQLRDRQKSERKKLKRENEVMVLLPQTEVSAKFVCQHQNHVSISYGMKYPERFTIAQALPILEAYASTVVISEHWKDGCIACRPKEINENATRPGSVLEGTSAVEMKFSAGRGYDSHELRMWCRVGKELAEVVIELRPEWKWMPDVKFTFSQSGDCITNHCAPRSIGEDSRLKFWSPAGSYQFSYYWADLHNWRAWASHELAVKA